MKRTKLIPLIIILVVVVLILYRLHELKKAQVVFSDDGLIMSDGGGPYEDAAQGVRVGISRGGGIFLDLSDSSRFVYVKFEDMRWKDYMLRDVASPLQSKRYRIVLGALVPGKALTDMAVGEHAEPDVGIQFCDVDTGRIVSSAVRTLTGTIYYDDSMTLIQPPKPPLILYEDGHIDLVRISEDTWIVQGEAWFNLVLLSLTGEVLHNYNIKLSLKIAIVMKSLI